MDGYLLVTLPCRTRAAPGLPARTRSRASPSSRTRTRAGHVTIRPGYRLYTMGPAHAHASGSHLGPTAKLKSRPLRTSRRLAGLTRTAQWDALLSRHDSLRPPASSGCTSRTNHDSTQPTCAQWSWSRSSRTGVAGPAPGPTAADPSGATRLTLPPHPLRSRNAHPTPSGRLSPDCPPQSCTYQASPPERADSQGCE